MKSTRSARRMLKNRRTLLLAGLLMVIVVEFVVGEVLVAHFGQVTGPETEQVPTSNASLGEALVSVP